MKGFTEQAGTMSFETEFQSEEIHLIASEKAIIGIIWFLIEAIGSVLLIGLVQFERLNGDPCKCPRTSFFEHQTNSNVFILW